MQIIRRGPDLQLQVECWAENGKENGKYLSTAGQAFSVTGTHSYIRTCNVCVPSSCTNLWGAICQYQQTLQNQFPFHVAFPFPLDSSLLSIHPVFLEFQSRSHGHLEVLGIHPKDLGRSICTPVEPRYTENIDCSSYMVVSQNKGTPI